MMQVSVKPPLDQRLLELARERGISVDELVGNVLAKYLDGMDGDGSPWVHGTQNQLGKVWPAEDFSSWGPPVLSPR